MVAKVARIQDPQESIKIQGRLVIKIRGHLDKIQDCLEIKGTKIQDPLTTKEIKIQNHLGIMGIKIQDWMEVHTGTTTLPQFATPIKRHMSKFANTSRYSRLAIPRIILLILNAHTESLQGGEL